MRNRRITAYLAAFLSIATVADGSQSSSALELTEEVRASAERFLAECARLQRLSGVVLIARAGTVLFERAYGLADVERGQLNTLDTRFRIASLTKPFTAAAVLLLHQRGRLSLDDAVCQYLKDCPSAWKAITVRDLLSHRSGIPEYMDLPEVLAQRQQLPLGMVDRLLRTQPLHFPAGAKFEYSNSNYWLVGDIIETVAEKPFATFLTDELLAPAGLKNTGFTSVAPIVESSANGHRWRRGKVVNAPPSFRIGPRLVCRNARGSHGLRA